jgi:hypothetical protein
MPRSKQIKITKDGEEGYALESALPAWERNGWTRADDGSSEEEAEVTEHPIETQVEESTPEAEAAPAKKTTRKAP